MVSKDVNELHEGIVGGCHDDRDLDFAVHHEEMDEAANDPLILLLVDRGGILGVLEEVHGVWRSLSGERVRAAGRENLEDGMEHGCSEGAMQDAGVALVQLEDGLVPEAAASEDRGAIVNMGVEDHH